MKIGDRHWRTIWLASDGWSVEVIDQTKLPHALETVCLRTGAEAALAIRAMVVRGAPLIGVTAAYGLALALRADPSDSGLARAAELLIAARPTAVNLAWAVGQVRDAVQGLDSSTRAGAAYSIAARIAEDDIAACAAIGEHGASLIKEAARSKAGPVNVLTHCNAGWLAAVDWGTALAPIYRAHDDGVPVHVWVDETRPRNQGAGLTAWELGRHGVPHTVVVDNAGGHLMQHGKVDLCIVGSDRTTASGDVCNKVGTYLKALAARDNGVPFYAALPSSTIDWDIADGVRSIPIEEREGREVGEVRGLDEDGRIRSVRITPEGTPVANYAFDVTPARLVTGIITERGVAQASHDGLAALFPERRGE